MKTLLNKLTRHISRNMNNFHRYDFSPENMGWQKYGIYPVVGDATTGSLFDPYCYYHDELFYMVVSERRTGSIILKQSVDGKKWQHVQTLLTGIANSWEEIVNRGCLLSHKGCKYLWYTGQFNGKASIGLAVCCDGINFTRVSNEPVLTASLPEEGVSVMNPCVIWDESASLFKMWYSAGENYEPDVICYAVSEDGIHWSKYLNPVLEKYHKHKWEQAKVGGCQVLKNEAGYYTMYYIGYQNVDVARICLAQSKDGIRWERPDNNLLLGPSKGSWDADATYKPSVVEVKGIKYLWYNGRKKNEEFIGLANKAI